MSAWWQSVRQVRRGSWCNEKQVTWWQKTLDNHAGRALFGTGENAGRQCNLQAP